MLTGKVSDVSKKNSFHLQGQVLDESTVLGLPDQEDEGIAILRMSVKIYQSILRNNSRLKYSATLPCETRISYLSYIKPQNDNTYLLTYSMEQSPS